MADRPYQFVKQQMVRILGLKCFVISNFICSQASGTALASLTSDALENKHLTPEEEFDLKWAALSLYAGAVIFGAL
jgi:hypothetical protein